MIQTTQLSERLLTRSCDQGDLLERIVKDVITEIVKREPLEVSPYPVVGLEQALEDLQVTIKQFDLHDTLIVGIVGVEGSGKSTLAKHFYNLKRLGFSRSCFLSEVSKSKEKLPSLQHKLLRDLLGYSYSDIDTIDISQGKNLLLRGLRSTPVLIVFDGVDQIEQIKSVLNIDDVGQGSLIVITSFDQNVFRRLSRKTRTVFHMVKPLQENYARELFCQCAFSQYEPHEGFEDLVDEVLKLCGGMPLSLTVLGAELSDMQDRNVWNPQLRKWSRSGLPHSIINHLKVMYEVLNSDEKNVFLDIGRSLLGVDKDHLVRVLDEYGHTDVCHCMESLRRKGLIDYEIIVQCQPGSQCQEERQGNCDQPDLQFPTETYKITMINPIKELARYMHGTIK